MEQICRFCQKRQIYLLYSANKNTRYKGAQLFACTNCGFGLHGPIVKCRHCQMVYVDEKITQEKISTYYEIAEDPLYLAEQGARKITFGHYLQKLERVFPKRGRLLDVGTNTGLFVYIAKEAGWDAVGIEPNRWGVRYAKKNFGLTLVNKPFDRKAFTKESFDVITMWDVIEHFTNPIEQMENVYWYLKPGGVFAFSTVDPDSLLARAMGNSWSWYMEMHRAFLNHQAAKHYLIKVGFKKVTFSPHWRFLSLGYLATRLQAINGSLAKSSSKIINSFGLEKTVVPYYANDLFDCYAYK